jgi:hypothetical protein
MKNEELQDLMPYENHTTFDHERRLLWCIDAMLNAIRYYREAFEEETTRDTLLDELERYNQRVIISLLYGALRAADEQMTPFMFARIYKKNNLKQYIDVVLEGVVHYLPHPGEQAKHSRKLDESWPDTQSEVKKKTPAWTGDGGSGLPKTKRGSASRSSKAQPKEHSQSS